MQLSASLTARIESLYQDMQSSYDTVATSISLTCDGCPDNCCDSYFMHYTYIEWAYLWQGIEQLDESQQREILDRAAAYERACEADLARGDRPQHMCPLNQDGRCVLYQHRLMVCRTHGVPAKMTRPDGQVLQFPGCFRCQQEVGQLGAEQADTPHVERTPLLRRLVELEQDFLQGRRHLAPRIKMTIARMLLSGPPQLPSCGAASCDSEQD